MKKSEIIALGITEEIAQKIVDLSTEELKGFIPKSRFDEVNEARKNAEALLKERDTQLETLKASTGDAEALKVKITELQDSNKKAVEAKDAEIRQIRIDNAVERAISQANGRNAKAIKALLDLSSAELDENGAVKGLDKQIKTLSEAEDSSFLFGSSLPEVKGITPAGGADQTNGKVDFSKMSYSQISEYLAANPDAKIS